MKMERTDCSETSTHKTQTPANYPEETIKHTEYGESLNSRNGIVFPTRCYEGVWGVRGIDPLFLRN